MSNYSTKKQWKIGVIGDHFMKNEFSIKSIKEKLNENKIDFLIEDLFTEFPYDVITSNNEVLEYVGNEEIIKNFVKDKDILVIHLAPVTRKIIENAENLKLIAVSRGGPVNINYEACNERNIIVSNTPGKNAQAVAEFTLSAIVTLTRDIMWGHNALSKGHWRHDLL